MILEGTGQQTMEASTDHRDAEPIEQSFTLEVEYTELPTKTREGSDRGAYLMRLDALYFRNFQTKTPPQTIELAGDRLRVLSGKDKVEMDLEGAQPEEGLTPRMLLQQIFGMVIYNEDGEALSVQMRGRPRAREFLKRFPIQGAIRFSRVPRPGEPISPGHSWNAELFPPNVLGGLGLRLDVQYSLAGFRDIAGVRCAWILLEANREGTKIPSEAGFVFDRVRAEIRGEAFIEVETARLRRLLVIDDARGQYQRGKAPNPVVQHRIRNKGRMLIELVRTHNELAADAVKPIRCYVGWPLPLDDEEKSAYKWEATFERVGRPPDITEELDAALVEEPRTFLSYADRPELRYAWARGMTAMRERQVADVDARIVIGGKTGLTVDATADGGVRPEWYSGRMPGVLEEVVLAARAEQPVFLVGAFGGVASLVMDVIDGVEREEMTWEFQRGCPHSDRLREMYRERGDEWLDYPDVAESLRGRGLDGLAPLPEDRHRELFAARHIEGILPPLLEGLGAIG